MASFQILHSFVFLKQRIEGQISFLAMYTTTKKEKNPDVKNEDEFLAGQLNATGEIDQTQFIGSAVFKNGVMIDKLNGQETRIVNILDDTTELTSTSNDRDPFSDNQMVAVRVMKTGNNRIKMNLKGSKPKIQITLPLQFEILTNPSTTRLCKK